MANIKYASTTNENNEVVKVELISSHTYNQTQIVSGAMTKHKAFLREQDFNAAESELQDAERAIAKLRVELERKRAQAQQ